MQYLIAVIGYIVLETYLSARSLNASIRQFGVMPAGRQLAIQTYIAQSLGKNFMKNYSTDLRQKTCAPS